MKKIMLYIYGLVLLTGCSEAKYKFFDDCSRVQMMSANKDLLHNFYYEDRETVSRDTVYLSVAIIGGSIPEEYSIALRQIPEYDVKYVYDNKGNLVDSVKTEKPNKAEAGVHYVAMDSEEMKPLLIAKPGSTSAAIPVILLRDESLRTREFRLCLELVATSDFQLGERNALSRTIVVTDKLSKPKRWDDVEQYFWGAYSERKHEFITEVVQETVDDNFIYQLMLNSSELQYVTSKCKRELNIYNNDPENIRLGLSPMREDQNNPQSPLVTFP